MYILLIIVGGIAALTGLVLLVALAAPKDYSIHRSIVIERPVPVVYDYLRHLKNQDAFNVWVQRDPNMKKTYTGTDGEVGFEYAWDGDKRAGAGIQRIKHLVPNARIDAEVTFIRPFAAVAQTPFTLAPAGENATQVTWSMNSAMKYPMNIMLLMMNMDKMLGKDMEHSLGLLKAAVEQQPDGAATPVS